MALFRVDKCDPRGEVVVPKAPAGLAEPALFEGQRLELERQAAFARSYSGGLGLDPVLASHLGLNWEGVKRGRSVDRLEDGTAKRLRSKID